jgi:glycosyltransferase involved in cell wall biosynthesis
MPNVSALMTVYNGARFLRPALESVLSQTHRDLELIVVDDGSEDNSSEIVRSMRDPRIVFIPSGHVGRVAALNLGLQHARSPFVAILDADDIARAERFRLQSAALQSAEGLAFVGSFYDIVDEHDVRIDRVAMWFNPVYAAWRLQFVNHVAHSTVMFRRDAARDLGGYDDRFRVCHDYDFLLRLASRGALFTIPRFLGTYRHYAAPRITTAGELMIAEAQAISHATLKVLAPDLGDDECRAAQAVYSPYTRSEFTPDACDVVLDLADRFRTTRGLTESEADLFYRDVHADLLHSLFRYARMKGGREGRRGVRFLRLGLGRLLKRMGTATAHRLLKRTDVYESLVASIADAYPGGIGRCALHR